MSRDFVVEGTPACEVAGPEIDEQRSSYYVLKLDVKLWCFDEERTELVLVAEESRARRSWTGINPGSKDNTEVSQSTKIANQPESCIYT
jgi:hypothetical protein